MSKIIISAPLVFPRIEPDSWEEWWSVWNKESAFTVKTKQTHNNLMSPWNGFDIWVKPGFENKAVDVYNFKNINRPDLFSKLFNNLDEFPIDIDIVRAASSFHAVIPHNDFIIPTYSIRTMLYDENPAQTWFYIFNKQLRPLLLPDNSNTWIYPDHEAKHGSFFKEGYKKILIIYYGKIKPGFLEKTLRNSETKYKDYIIYK
jgi:hypothetical protein